MKLEFGYGKGIQTVEVPDANVKAVMLSNEMEHQRRGADAVKHALKHPVGTPRLKELAAAKMAEFAAKCGSAANSSAKACEAAADGSASAAPRFVIITSDISRPLPSYDVLPSVLDELSSAGINDDQITVVFGLGSHRGHTPEEMKRLVGEDVFARVRCVDSDPADCVNFGTTKRGTPVDITRIVAEADFRIALGNVEFHYFAGYSGGYKALMPGVSTPAAIQANHSMMVREEAKAASLEGNPIREDIEEAGAMVGLDFIVNVVLDEHKKIVYAAAGHPVAAHRDACRYLDRMYIKPIDEPADIVIVSQGGAPKDVNLYQTQKALDNASHAVKKGGTVILIGACPEGLGNKVFEEWIRAAEKPEDLLTRVRENFKLGGHKAAAIAMVLKNAEIMLVSEMDDAFVRSIFLTPMPSAQAAFDAAFAKHGPAAIVIAMPFGGATLPVLR
ncbi:MAG: nickel-dependent lactate racemase [Firmicutes bacterium]|nr:nickel-dependent lactate racemase [Bacillota bacterium]